MLSLSRALDWGKYQTYALAEIKGIESILFLRNGLKKKLQKKL
jgi:hypothetical protein